MAEAIGLNPSNAKASLPSHLALSLFLLLSYTYLLLDLTRNERKQPTDKLPTAVSLHGRQRFNLSYTLKRARSRLKCYIVPVSYTVYQSALSFGGRSRSTLLHKNVSWSRAAPRESRYILIRRTSIQLDLPLVIQPGALVTYQYAVRPFCSTTDLVGADAVPISWDPYDRLRSTTIRRYRFISTLVCLAEGQAFSLDGRKSTRYSWWLAFRRSVVPSVPGSFGDRALSRPLQHKRRAMNIQF